MLPSGNGPLVGGESSSFRPVQAVRQPFAPVPPSAPAHRPDHRFTSFPARSSCTPFLAATVQLLDVYKRICPDFHFTHNVPRRCLTHPNDPCYNDDLDNSAHDYILHVNDVLIDPSNPMDEYVVLDLLGTGTFGQVVKCYHQASASLVAVKIVKNQQAYFNQAWMEIGILGMLHKDHTEEETRHIVRLLHHFVLRGHLCLVFEKLSINLYELLKQNRYAGVNLHMLRSFLTQLLKALTVLLDAEVVHCDVKPENILLSSLDSAELKLIDFGSACQLQHPIYSYVQSRFYRSPEILLGMPNYDSKIDMWSLGCVAGELFLGIPMFPGQNGMNMICRISEMLGDFPDMFLRRCPNTSKYFKLASSGGNLRVFQLKSVAEYEEEFNVILPDWKRYFKERRLREVIMSGAQRSQHPDASDIALRESFVDLLSGMLKIDPSERWSPQEALLHPFITHGPLPNGQPWQPPAASRRNVARTRPVAIDGHGQSSMQDLPISASAPNFAGRSRLQSTSFRPEPAGEQKGPAVVQGASSYIHTSVFTPFETQSRSNDPDKLGRLPPDAPTQDSDVLSAIPGSDLAAESPTPMEVSGARSPAADQRDTTFLLEAASRVRRVSSPLGVPRPPGKEQASRELRERERLSVDQPASLDGPHVSLVGSVNEPVFEISSDEDGNGIQDRSDSND